MRRVEENGQYQIIHSRRQTAPRLPTKGMTLNYISMRCFFFSTDPLHMLNQASLPCNSFFFVFFLLESRIFPAMLGQCNSFIKYLEISFNECSIYIIWLLRIYMTTTLSYPISRCGICPHPGFFSVRASSFLMEGECKWCNDVTVWNELIKNNATFYSTPNLCGQDMCLWLWDLIRTCTLYSLGRSFRLPLSNWLMAIPR